MVSKNNRNLQPPMHVELQPFGRAYATYYDLLYRDKDYHGEAKIVKALLKKLSPGARSLLELGCGTGNFTLLLSKHFKVTAVERSPHMLSVARMKLEGSGVRFLQGDLADLLPKMSDKFDACVALFHVVNYLRTKRELKSLLGMVHSHLKIGGSMIFDSWNGSAVLRQRPSFRVKTVVLGRETIVRIAEPHLHRSTSSCDVLYRVFVLRGNRVVKAFRENHRIRYYGPEELHSLLTSSGFRAIKLTSYEKSTPLKDSWSMLAMARRA